MKNVLPTVADVDRLSSEALDRIRRIETNSEPRWRYGGEAMEARRVIKAEILESPVVDREPGSRRD